MGHPIVVFEKPNVEAHKKLYKMLLEEWPGVIQNTDDVIKLLWLCNKVGIEPIFVLGMNRSERSMVPANYTFIILVPTMFGVIKFPVLSEELGFNKKTWAYRYDPIENLRYKWVRMPDGREYRLDNFKFQKMYTFGSYY